MKRTLTTLAIAGVIGAAGVTTPAVAATTPAVAATTPAQTYSGTGWSIFANYLDAGTWKIEWYDSATRTAVKPYAKLTSANLKAATGTTFTVTDTIRKTTADCPAYHTIVIRLDAATTRSHSAFCLNADRGQTSSSVVLAKSSWTTTLHQGTHENYRRHVVSHELGHAAGQGHAVTCTCNPQPLMRGDRWGGYGQTSYADNYTPQDLAGFKALVANRTRTAVR